MTDTTTAPSVHDLETWLTRRVADYGDLEPAGVDPTVALAELGLDSVYALALCGDIEDTFGIEVDPTIAWDHPTIEQLAGALAGRFVP